ncbi:hypothetical protein H2199_008784 [Coniosporium tulheliwenetii]|uniref:Uncharacterized protein n=1 Tax=Coniosporium tulheliwenetii TaxID=3383036 RepID=A0ACC2YI55_9PEZI|nr:hypothetical protein H2199_008784 [Cladosporium sp. JES 115]
MPDRQYIESVIGYHFVQPQLLDEALLAAGASVARKNTHGPSEGNKRLALVGDAALQLAILDDEGSRLVKSFASNNKLRDVAKERGVHDHITKNPAQEGEAPRATLASTIEAVIGAVWVDSKKDIGTVQTVVKNLSL